MLRVQVLSCHDLQAKMSNGYSDPCARFFVILPVYLADLPLPALPRSLRLRSFVVVSILGNVCKTPVCRRNLNPVYKPREATFEFPISLSAVHKFSSLDLKFVVWKKGMIGKDFLGENAFSINEWFKGTAIAFDDPDNEVCPFAAEGTKSRDLHSPSQPIQVKLLSSPTIRIRRGTVRVKLGFTHPPDSTSKPDFRYSYNMLRLADPVLAPRPDHAGIVTLLIGDARNLPKWPTGKLLVPCNVPSPLNRSQVIRMGWDMDPYVQVTIGEEVKRTQVIMHSLNPVWDKQLVFHVRESDLSLPILLSVYDWDIFSFHNHVGDIKIFISELVIPSRKGGSTESYPYDIFAMREFYTVALDMNKKREYKHRPTITFR